MGVWQTDRCDGAGCVAAFMSAQRAMMFPYTPVDKGREGERKRM